MTRLFSLLFLFTIGFFSSQYVVHSGDDKIKTFELKGYITQVNSPTSFEIDEYKMSLDGKYDVDLQNVEDKAVKFDPATHIRVGTFVKIKSRVNTDTLEAKVEDITIDAQQFRRLSRTTIIDSAPTDLIKTDDGRWTGTILADARRIVVTSETNVRFRLNKSEEREAKQKKKQDEEQKELEAAQKAEQEKAAREAEKVENKSGDEEDQGEDSVEELSVGSKPLQSLSDVIPGVYMTYKGIENFEGSLVASDVVFVKNEKTKQEKDMWKDARIKAKESKKTNSFEILKIAGTKYKALPDPEIQEYVNQLGQSLVPEYQKNLPDDNENKIPFRFIVVDGKYVNAAAYPTGTVIVHDDDFNFLENEAQLAFLLSHEIAHATQEHALRQANHLKSTRTWLRIAAFAVGGGIGQALLMTEKAIETGYGRVSENQADRIGMANMIHYGFDPREGVRMWKVMSMNFGDQTTNLFWSDHNSHSERRSFLMVTLRNTYASLNFSDLKKDSLEFQKIVAMVKEKYPTKVKKRKA
jgi:hypothetical protein